MANAKYFLRLRLPAERLNNGLCLSLLVNIGEERDVCVCLGQTCTLVKARLSLVSKGQSSKGLIYSLSNFWLLNMNWVHFCLLFINMDLWTKTPVIFQLVKCVKNDNPEFIHSIVLVVYKNNFLIYWQKCIKVSLCQKGNVKFNNRWLELSDGLKSFSNKDGFCQSKDILHFLGKVWQRNRRYLRSNQTSHQKGNEVKPWG